MEVLDAGRSLETTRAEEGSRIGIEAEGSVAAVLECPGQPALHATCRDPGHAVGKATIGAHRQPSKDVIFSKPGGPACAFHDQAPFLAIQRVEMTVVVRRYFDAGHRADIEARFIEHHDDVRKLGSRLASALGASGELADGLGVGLKYWLRR